MTQPATIYSIQTKDKRDELSVVKAGDVSLREAYTSLLVHSIGGRSILIGYDKQSHRCGTYALTDKEPFIESVENQLHLGGPWDCIEPFVLGNQPHLMCYERKKGEFGIFPLTDQIESHYPLHFHHPRAPFTTDLTTVMPLVSVGQVFIFGYNQANGDVNIWTLSTTATSIGKHPPLAMNVVWAHQWAKGWTRFAFFTWGGENFFLKTNTWKPNVNIDHLSNVLSVGSNEVGSYLDLENAQELDIVHPFYGTDLSPHFMTYIAKSGLLTLNRVHGDCLGWTTVASTEVQSGAQRIVPFAIEGANYLLFG